MKRTILWVFILAVFLLLPGKENGFAGNRFMVVVTGNYLGPWDQEFKDFYGNGHFYPEVKLGVTLSPDFYLWAGYGWLSAKEGTPVLNLEVKARQAFLSAGVGYLFPVARKLGYKGEVGLLLASYSEGGMEEEWSGSALGFRLDNALVLSLSKSFFVEVSLGFTTAADTIDDIKIKLGGFRTGLGLGVTF